MAGKKSHEQTVREAVKALVMPESLQYVSRSVDDGAPLTSQLAVEEIIDLCRAVIFPGYFGDTEFNNLNLPYYIGISVERLSRVLSRQIEAALHMASGIKGFDPAAIKPLSTRFADEFIVALPDLRRKLADDAEAIYRGDPAATSVGEVIYSYPAVRALTNYRVAHELHRLAVPVIPRMISEQAHRETGIDIHPAASIGRSFMIDHGTGVVIGETAIIGNNVRIYQGVTLGARSFPTDEGGNPVRGLSRHPIIGDDVVIYANSTILGRINIGAGSVIGGNIWVTEDVAPGSIVLQARANNTIRQINKLEISSKSNTQHNDERNI